MNDLALEIKKLAEKYRNSHSGYGNSGYGQLSTENCEEDFAENYFEDFDDQKLDELEGEIANFNQENNDVASDFVHEDESEIKIADFINPQVNVVKNSGYELLQEEVAQEIEFDREEKTAINGNIRLISKNLRDLKALLRENI